LLSAVVATRGPRLTVSYGWMDFIDRTRQSLWPPIDLLKWAADAAGAAAQNGKTAAETLSAQTQQLRRQVDDSLG
jgi:hypothetical protein